MDVMLQCFLTAAVIMDYKSGKIKNWLIVLGLSAGCVMQILFCQAVWYHLLGRMIFPILLLSLLFHMHALGAGDLKLFSVIGCFWSMQNLMLCILISFVTGAVISLSKLLIQKELVVSLSSFFSYLKKTYREKKITKYPGRDMVRRQMHFSVAILVGFFVTLGVNYGGFIYCFV